MVIMQYNTCLIQPLGPVLWQHLQVQLRERERETHGYHAVQHMSHPTTWSCSLAAPPGTAEREREREKHTVSMQYNTPAKISLGQTRMGWSYLHGSDKLIRNQSVENDINHACDCPIRQELELVTRFSELRYTGTARSSLGAMVIGLARILTFQQMLLNLQLRSIPFRPSLLRVLW